MSCTWWRGLHTHTSASASVGNEEAGVRQGYVLLLEVAVGKRRISVRRAGGLRQYGGGEGGLQEDDAGL